MGFGCCPSGVWALGKMAGDTHTGQVGPTVPLVWAEDWGSLLCAMDVAGFKAEGEVGGERISQVCHAENRAEEVRAAVGDQAADSVPGKTEGGWGGRGERELEDMFVLP